MGYSCGIAKLFIRAISEITASTRGSSTSLVFEKVILQILTNNSHRFHRLIKRTRISLIARINNFAIPREYPIDGQDLCELIIRAIRAIRVQKIYSLILGPLLAKVHS